MYNNYYCLLNIKVHHKITNIILFIAFIFTLIILLTNKIYNTYTIYGLYEDNTVKFDVPIEDGYKLINSKYFKVDSKAIKPKLKNISKIKSINNINYQTYTIMLKENHYENEILEVTFYYNKELIIKKLIKILY